MKCGTIIRQIAPERFYSSGWRGDHKRKKYAEGILEEGYVGLKSVWNMLLQKTALQLCSAKI